MSIPALFLALTLLGQSTSALPAAENCADWKKQFLYRLSDAGAYHLKGAPPETGALIKRELIFQGQFRPMIQDEGAATLESKMTLIPTPGHAIVLDGQKYIEMTNTTTFTYQWDPVTKQVVLEGGETRRVALPRAIRDEYYNTVQKLKGKHDPVGYVSDVPLYVEDANGKYQYRHMMLKSAPEKGFRFEDPRISIFIGEDGKPRFLLSGTDYSSHIPGNPNPDVMNRYVEITMDEHGYPKPIEVDPHTGKPDFKDFSPAPQRNADGSYTTVDAKNGIGAQNELGQYVLRSRFRLGDEYGEQIYVFNSFKEFEEYERKHLISDLGTANPHPKEGDRIRPVLAKKIIDGKDLKELYHDPNILIEKGKGLGPGTRPIRFIRRGNDLFMSEAVGMPEHYCGSLAGKNKKTFILKKNEVKFITGDHEIRYYQIDDFVKRHYSGDFKLFDHTLTNIEAFYGDALQPKMSYEVGVQSGIVDLGAHLYMMGVEIIPGKNGAPALLRFTAGTSDAHTVQYYIDPLKLLLEMSEGSEQRLSGQVYNIPKYPVRQVH